MEMLHDVHGTPSNFPFTQAVSLLCLNLTSDPWSLVWCSAWRKNSMQATDQNGKEGGKGGPGGKQEGPGGKQEAPGHQWLRARALSHTSQVCTH